MKPVFRTCCVSKRRIMAAVCTLKRLQLTAVVISCSVRIPSGSALLEKPWGGRWLFVRKDRPYIGHPQ